MKLFTLAAASLAMAIAAPALAQNVEKVGPAGGRILTADSGDIDFAREVAHSRRR